MNWPKKFWDASVEAGTGKQTSAIFVWYQPDLVEVLPDGERAQYNKAIMNTNHKK